MKSSFIPANRSKFILLVLISCNLILLLLTELSPDSQVENINKQEKSHEMKVEPVSFLASRFSVMIIAYLSTLTYVRKDLSLEELISTVRWTWRRPAITLLYLELITTASSSLLLMLIAFAKATRGVVALEALLLLSSLALFSWLGPVLFAHSDIACKLSVVASVVEHCQGQAALERASELIQGRKLFGFVLSCVLMVLEQVPFMVFGQKKSNGEVIENEGKRKCSARAH
ncbi:hypothetical protein J5N97_007834 [Dioscorea zingiberensis]|uniref:Uncharacterized protein n=1 Tax=Dioscorea zingiberensis TaxID=325984 RepID=A0A9D5HV07_9LILI|nr:hypothetical protein J5N97_007834 [Dioscorea zingiberensis]